MTAPAFQLADAGIDVWLGNSRGNLYSVDHEYLDQGKKEHKRAYWDFSWAEIGRYDIPAVIQYIIRVTGQDKLAYVGFSQGTI